MIARPIHSSKKVFFYPEVRTHPLNARQPLSRTGASERPGETEPVGGRRYYGGECGTTSRAIRARRQVSSRAQVT